MSVMSDSKIQLDKNTGKHRIRSFVRREGRFSQAQKQSIQNLWPKFGLTGNMGLVDFQKEFGNKRPVWLEIGFGNGESLAAMAANLPDVNFVGVEVHRPGVGRLLAQLERERIDNVRVAKDDAVEFLEQSVRANSLEKILIFFPDPWHKKRHHKRRLIQADFLDNLASRLISGGVIHIATDWQDYAEWMLEAIANSKSVHNISARFADKPEYRPLTKYEKRGQRLGHDVFDILVRV